MDIQRAQIFKGNFMKQMSVQKTSIFVPFARVAAADPGVKVKVTIIYTLIYNASFVRQLNAESQARVVNSQPKLVQFIDLD
jgi:hypothetical protein